MNNEHPFIAERIADAMQSLGNLPPRLAPATLQAGLHMATQLGNEHKIISVGLDSFAPLAQIFCNNLMFRNAEFRPGLPAISLNNDANSLAMLIANDNRDEFFSRSLKSLGQSGDVLVVLGESANSELMANTISSAKTRGMSCVVLCPQFDEKTMNTDNSGYEPSATVDDENVLYLTLEPTNLTRMHEVSLFILNCLNDIIDEQLFGGY